MTDPSFETPRQNSPSEAQATPPIEAKVDGSFGERLRKIGAELASLGSDVAHSAGIGIRETTANVLESASRGLGSAVTALRNGTHATAQSALEVLAPDVEVTKNFANQLHKVIPVVGAATRYAGAWKLFHQGKLEGDDAKLGRARVECVIALAEGGLDFATFGMSRAVAAGRFTAAALRAVTAIRTIDLIDPERMRIAERLATRLLRTPGLERAIDSVLSSVSPSLQATNAGKSEDDAPIVN